MEPRPTPEDAARGDIPAKYVRVVGTVIRGDLAVVAQLTNDGPVYEVETAYCHQIEGGWVEGSSGNGTGAFLPTSGERGTYVVWDEAPQWAVAARYALGAEEKTVAVENGFALAQFDDAPIWDRSGDPWDAWPTLVSWIDANGAACPPR